MTKFFTKLTLAFTAFTGVLFAQQDPQFTQFMHNKLIYNPGYAGTSDAICANVLYRQQWVNFPGAPKTGLFSFDMPIGRLPIGIGLNVMNDQIGFSKTTFARLAVSYLKRGLGAGNLGIGIDGGILQQQFNGNWITPDGNITQDPSIPNYAANGSPITNPNLNKLTYDLGFGAYYTIPNKMYVGISSTHLAAQDITAGGNVKYALARHYYVVAGYRFLLNQVHGIEPNVKIKSDAASTQVDINLTYWWNNTLWIGATYRMQDAVCPMLGYKFLKNKSLKVGYSYDVTLSKIKGYSAGTHEIMLGYCFNTSKPPKVTSHQSVRLLD
ncbi:MAG: type IX secretion system membrane protein PorP/SprF [Bacteroidetes bacterium]|nr:type IX secretion system membrane protein PorP/SprF [Bacteroidota bacterium]